MEHFTIKSHNNFIFISAETPKEKMYEAANVHRRCRRIHFHIRWYSFMEHFIIKSHNNFIFISEETLKVEIDEIFHKDQIIS